jgi:hypothetical protein
LYEDMAAAVAASTAKAAAIAVSASINLLAI